MTTAFAFPNLFLANTDLKVYVAGTLKVLITDYSVTGAGSPTGGNVTFVTAPASAASVVIFCEPDTLQNTKLPSNGPFPAATVEAMSDKLTLLAQRFQDRVARTLRLSDGDSDSGASLTLPTRSTLAGKFLAFDSSGTPIGSSGGMTGVPIETVGQVVGTVAALRAMTAPTTPLLVYTRSHSGLPGKGGRPYIWDDTSTAADNNGTVVMPASAPAAGRWIMLHSGRVMVDDFGASASATQAANTAAWQAAVTAAGVEGFALSAKPQTTYQLAAGFKWNKSGVTADFAQAAVVINTVGATGMDSDLENGATYPQFLNVKNLIITCPAGNVGGTCVNYRNSYSRFENIVHYVQGPSQTAMRLTDSATSHTQVYNSTWDDCFLIANANSPQTGLICDQVGQLAPNGNRFVGGRITGGFSVPVSLRGAGNKFDMQVEGIATGNKAVFVSNAAGAEGVGCSHNNVRANLEGDAGAYGVWIDTYANDSVVEGAFGTGFSAPGAFFTDNGIRTKHPYDITLTLAKTSLPDAGTTVLTGKLRRGSNNQATAEILVTAGTTTASTAGTSKLTGIPTNMLPTRHGTVIAVDTVSKASYGVGLVDTSGNIWLPTWGATANAVALTLAWPVG